jgi:hypothetical protein
MDRSESFDPNLSIRPLDRSRIRVRSAFDGVDPKRVVDPNVFHVHPACLMQIDSSRGPSRYNDLAGHRLSVDVCRNPR